MYFITDVFISGSVSHLAPQSRRLSERAGEGWHAKDTSNVGTASDACTAGHDHDDSWPDDGRRTTHTFSS